jgi:hypothetical protein
MGGARSSVIAGTLAMLASCVSDRDSSLSPKPRDSGAPDLGADAPTEVGSPPEVVTPIDAATPIDRPEASPDVAPDVPVDAGSAVVATSRDAHGLTDVVADLGAVCPAGMVICDEGCIPVGDCCGLPRSGVAAGVIPTYDLRRMVVSPRAVIVPTEPGTQTDASSGLVIEGGRVWFTFGSNECHGPATATFALSPGGVPSDVQVRCESVPGTVTAMAIRRDADGLLGCFSSPGRTADYVRCGRWSAGPGTWSLVGPVRGVVSAAVFDSPARPLAAWNVGDGGVGRLELVQLDRSLEVESERVIAASTGDAITDSLLVGGVRWLLRRPASRAQAPVLERLRGDELLPSLDVGTVGRFLDWHGSLAAAGGDVALMVKTPAGMTLLHVDETGFRGRTVLTGGSDQPGTLLPFEGGWFYAGSRGQSLWAVRTDCAGRLREAPIDLGFEGSLQRFGGVLPAPDGRGLWVLGTEWHSGLSRSIVRVGW